jgi:CYTH domain-containing protein
LIHETYTQPKQPLEIERKFLVPTLPEDLEKYDNTTIRQGYVAVAEDGAEMRIRAMSAKYTVTVKSQSPGNQTGMSRVEYEMPIPRSLFAKLWEQTEGNKIEKVRFYIPHNEHTIELDIYFGELEGLITAEVEFETEAAANSFVPPSWIGEDITKNKAFKNQNLARFGKPEYL